MSLTAASRTSERVVRRARPRREEQPRDLVDEDDVHGRVPCPSRPPRRLRHRFLFGPRSATSVVDGYVALSATASASVTTSFVAGPRAAACSADAARKKPKRPDRIQPRWVTNATAAAPRDARRRIASTTGFVNQVVTHGTISARLENAPMSTGHPRRFSRQAITARLTEVIAYDPSNPNANTFPSLNSSPPVVTTSSDRRRRDDDDRPARRPVALVAARHRRRQVAELADRLEHVVAADERDVGATSRKPAPVTATRDQQRAPAVGLRHRRQQRRVRADVAGLRRLDGDRA